MPLPSSMLERCAWLYNDPQRFAQAIDNLLHNIEAAADLNAFVQVYRQDVTAGVASLLQRRQARQPLGRLAGLTFGLKDLLAYQDHPLQASSAILAGFIAQYTATSVARLLAADGLVLGHQNCDEFGMGSTNENSVYGPCHHPLDHSLVPGGSSGGSAAAIAAGLGDVALGTDTGGSVRQPAALCGILGLKPSYGRVSRYGVVAHASSCDTVGLLSTSSEALARTLEAVAGHDPYDNTSSPFPVPSYTAALQRPLSTQRIAYLEETLHHPSLDPAVQASTWSAIAALRDAGHQVAPISLPLLPYILPAYYILTSAEASSNLARYDGMRYGYRATCKTLAQTYVVTRDQGFGKEVKRRIFLGNFVLNRGYHLQAQKVRRMVVDAFARIFEAYDLVLTPTVPQTAWPIGSKPEPLARYLADLFTVPASLAGLPAISLPYGRDGQGLPIGMQLIAPPFQEALLLTMASSWLGL